MRRKMLTAAKSVVILPDVLYLYRQHEGSVTKRALDANAEIMDAIDDVLTWYQARGLFEQYETNSASSAWTTCSMMRPCAFSRRRARTRCCRSCWTLPPRASPTTGHNPYLKGYPARKKLVLSLLGKQQYRAVHLLFAARPDH